MNDLYVFFQCNKFEQLCVNFCAETIEQFYTTKVFKRTQDVCRYGDCSQDRFWRGAGPQKSGPYEPKKCTILTSQPSLFYKNKNKKKNTFLAHFVAKSGPFGRFGWCVVVTPHHTWLRACKGPNSNVWSSRVRTATRFASGIKMHPNHLNVACLHIKFI